MSNLLRIMNYILIKAKNFNEARKKIRESKKKGYEIIFSGDDELNRKILEKEEIDVLLINVLKRKDWMKQKDSGFNHVLAEIARKKNISIAINLDEIINANTPHEKSRILGRIMQNIKLCNKKDLRMTFYSPSKKEKDRKDLQALGLVLGMPTWMIKGT